MPWFCKKLKILSHYIWKENLNLLDLMCSLWNEKKTSHVTVTSCVNPHFYTILTGFEPIIAKNVQKINFKFTMISIFTTLFQYDWSCEDVIRSNWPYVRCAQMIVSIWKLYSSDVCASVWALCGLNSLGTTIVAPMWPHILTHTCAF